MVAENSVRERERSLCTSAAGSFGQGWPAPYRCLIPLHFWVACRLEKLWGKKQEIQA